MNNEQKTMSREGAINVKITSDAHCSMLNEFGFTLIEALVALVVLTLALGPALVLSSNISSTASVIQHNLIAANLSQEGLEVVRALRDANWYNGLPFDTGLSDGIYRIEWNSNTLIALGANPPLKLSAGLYNYSSGTDTVFKRTVTITKINSEELRIISAVAWTERGSRVRDVRAESHLFDWK
ncbi:MAG: prepilin-type N-terminal cleavage/methylation domain-containing protein [Patescibacteria group bacterium]